MNAEERARLLTERLTGERAEAEWVEVVAAAQAELMARPWVELWPRSVAESAIAAHRTPERGRAIGRLVAQSIRATVQTRSEDDAPLQRFVEPPLEDALVRLVRRPGLVPEAWIRHVFAQKASEELAADTLYRTLRDFSTIVPRTLANVLPGLLGRFAKLGSSIADRVVDEVEPRLEPEIRRFVEAGTRRALDRAADFAIRHVDADVNRDGRESLLRFWLTSPARDLVAPLSEDVLSDIDVIADEIGKIWATSSVVTDELSAWLDEVYAGREGETVAELVERTCGPVELPFEAWAKAAWPAVRAGLKTSAIAEWLERLTAEMAALDEGPA